MDIEIDYVLSVSSEDESSPASNLTMGRRWTVAEKGISEATVDLKFKKSSIIKSISIGRVGFGTICSFIFDKILEKKNCTTNQI